MLDRYGARSLTDEDGTVHAMAESLHSVSCPAFRTPLGFAHRSFRPQHLALGSWVATGCQTDGKIPQLVMVWLEQYSHWIRSLVDFQPGRADWLQNETYIVWYKRKVDRELEEVTEHPPTEEDGSLPLVGLGLSSTRTAVSVLPRTKL